MKTPRVHDFDPDAKIPELTSPLDDFPSIQKPQQKSLPSQQLPKESDLKKKKETEPPPVRPYVRTPVRDHARTGVYNLFIICFIILIGLKKPGVKAKGINHPKVSTHGVLPPVSSASLLASGSTSIRSGRHSRSQRCKQGTGRATCRYKIK